MQKWITGRNLKLAAGCAGAAALLFVPGTLLTLGLGAALGYQGRGWLEERAGSCGTPDLCAVLHQFFHSEKGGASQ